MIPKPPKRIRSPETLSRFANTRTWCQVCGTPSSLHIHHLGDAQGHHRRSDVEDNLMRLCFACHEKFHAAAAWTRQQLRELKAWDEAERRYDYEENEIYYNRENS